MAIFEDKVVQQYVNEVLDTLCPVESFCEVDNSLVGEVGDEVEIWRYTDTGAAEKVAYGEGNTGYSDADGEAYSFKVGIAQDRVKIYDEDIKKNPTVVNFKMTIPAKHIVNTMRQDIVDQWYETSNVFPVSSASGLPTVNELLIAPSNLDMGVDNGLNGGEETIGLFLNPKDFRKFQAYLAQANADVQYEVINGKRYMRVAGIGIEASDFIIEGSPILCTNKAVRLLHSTCKNTESERDANVRLSTYYVRDNYVAGLEFENKALVLGVGYDITVSAATHGTVEALEKSVANATVKIKATPDSGYAVSAIAVTDGDGNTVPVDLTHKTFVMPASDVTIAVTFA